MARPPLALQFGTLTALLVSASLYLGHLPWPQGTPALGDLVTNALQYLSNPGWIGFLLVQVTISIIGFVPASLVCVSAGAAYGVTTGFVMASVGTLTGAVIAFLLSRSLIRPLIERKIGAKARLSDIDRHIGNRGWRLVCLLRLSPIMPFAVTSYALGLSSITLVQYLIGTLASLPSLLVYVLAGVFARTGVTGWSEGSNALRLALLAIGALSMVVLVTQVTHLIHRTVLAPMATVPNLSRIGIAPRLVRLILQAPPKLRSVPRLLAH